MMDDAPPTLPASLDVFQAIIDVENAVARLASLALDCFVDGRRWLHRSFFERVNVTIKVAEEGERLANVRDGKFVGV